MLIESHSVSNLTPVILIWHSRAQKNNTISKYALHSNIKKSLVKTY